MNKVQGKIKKWSSTAEAIQKTLLEYKHFFFDFYLAEGRTLHFPLTCLWHSGLFLSLLNRFFQRNYISGFFFSWKSMGLYVLPQRSNFGTIHFGDIVAVMIKWLEPLGTNPPEIWYFFLLHYSIFLLPLLFILKTFPHVHFLDLSITLFFTKVKNGLVHFIKLCKK